MDIFDWLAVSSLIVAIGMASWKIIDTLRDRPDIKINTILHPQNSNIVIFNVSNSGHRVVDLIGIGFQLSNGQIFDVPRKWGYSMGWVFINRPSEIEMGINGFSSVVIDKALDL